ncbi:SLC13 family permease [Thiopseudomonas acetoxidans]|uniref:SLC13 family permease n=1 Tax=Thiopseudomonas acetoxidans TaxID=3041622 RepID=A0ABT7SS81_9GAMM|nr:SLC13 family permease [Thiopseudomonas sp. CY1220]MDM7858419.1 SLC13 family permease [Thiopseudomonas sp. CY1220]
MTLEIFLVLLITMVALVLFVTEKLRIDAIAILVLVSLTLLDLVSPGQALSGFSNAATITVASMFILAAGLQNSGALAGIQKLLSAARSPLQFMLMLFGLLALIAPFVNNTAVVAIFIPIVIAASLKVGLAPSKALIPLSYVAQMMGVVTLIGSSTNLLVNSIAKDLGHPGFSMFEFFPLAVICAIAGCLYLLTFGRWLLPEVRSADLENLYEFGHYISELKITEDSKLLGVSVEEAQLSKNYNVFILELLRDGEKYWAPRSEKLQEGDILLARGVWSALEALKDEQKLEFNTQTDFQLKGRKQGKSVLTEVMIAPQSRAAGRLLAELNRSWRYNASVMGVQRRGQVLRSQLNSLRLRIGDILLLALPEKDLAALRKDKSVIVISQREASQDYGWRAPFAVATMAAVVIVSALGWLPIAISALTGAVAMTLAGCIHADDVYESTDWSIVILIAGLLPLGIAMSSSGAAQFLVDNSIGLVSHLGPHVVLAVLYLMALLFGELMSNSAAAVLLTPIGFSTAQLMGADPTPFLIAITFAASTSFMTPVGYQTNMMVYSAGGYKFSDFIKVGLPLNSIFWVLGVIFIPLFWPF